MSKHIYIDVGAKELTVEGCVRLSPNRTYTDYIKKGFEYTGESPLTVGFTNYCAQRFDIPAMILFKDETDGGNFEVRVAAFSILPSQNINVPVTYHGIHKGTGNPKTYLLSFNGSNASYRLFITEPVVNTPPVINSFEIFLNNREGKVFTLRDFSTRYFDADGDALDAVILEGDVAGFKLNGENITSGQEIPANLISAGAFQFVPQQTDKEINITVALKVKDDAGSVSN